MQGLMERGCKSKEGAGHLYDAAVVDVLYLTYLFLVVLMSTLGYSSEDSAYRLIVGFGAIFAFLRIAAMPFDGKYLIAVFGLIALSLIELAISRRFTLVLTVLLLVSAKGIETRAVMKVFFAAKVIGLALLAVFVITGVFEVEMYQYYKIVSAGYVQRMTINGSGTTLLHLSAIACISLWFYLREGRVSGFFYLVGLVANALAYRISVSTMGFLMGFGCLALFYAVSRFEKTRALFVGCSKWALPVLLVFSFGTAALYGGNALVNWLDKLFQGRIYYNSYFLSAYPLSLFGHGMLTSEGNFDNSFVFVWVAYGALTFTVLFAAMQRVVCDFIKQEAWVPLALICIFLLIGLSESFYPSAAVNPTLFFLVPLIGKEFQRVKGRKTKGLSVQKPIDAI